MSLSKRNLAEKIKRRFGYPVVKVELDPSQIYDAIDYAKSLFVKWAIGQATQETFFTVLLSAGENIYDLPIGVTEVMAYNDQYISTYGGINTLFTIDNYLYSQGMFEALYKTGGNWNLISYHIARDFLETVNRYTPSTYNWKYHRYTNQLEIHPAPSTGSSLDIIDEDGNTKTIDSPGYIMLRTMMIEGSSIDGWAAGGTDEHFYGTDWIFDYATAECKVMLGRIRSKFANFASIGNQGISLDGDTLISEGLQDKERLEERLKLEEVWEGGAILIG